MTNEQYYKRENLCINMFSFDEPIDYKGTIMKGVLEIWYKTKHSPENIKLRSIPVEHLDYAYLRYIYTTWLNEQYIESPFGRRKPNLKGRNTQTITVDATNTEARIEPAIMTTTQDIETAVDNKLASLAEELRELFDDFLKK